MIRLAAVWRSPGVLLPAAILIGLWLRLLPCVRDPGFQFAVDAAYHARLVENTVAAGALPAVDSLCTAPLGRRTAQVLPAGLYVLGAAFHRALAALGSPHLRWNLALLIALAGALIALPVWLAARAAVGSAAAASAAAIAAVLIPAHLQRSYGFWLRYDALGTLFAVAHVAMFVQALAYSRPGPRRAWAVAAAVCLVAALWIWRVNLLVLGFEAAFVAWRLLSRGAEPALREVWTAIAIGAAGAAWCVGYLNAQGFATSPLMIATATLALALWVPGIGAQGHRGLRSAALAAVGALAALAGRHGVGGGYDSLVSLLLARMRSGAAHDGLTTLMQQVEELHAMSLWQFLSGRHDMFVLGAWLAATPILWRWLAPPASAIAADETALPRAAICFITAGLAIATLMFERTVMLLAPFAVVALAMLAARLLVVAQPAARTAEQKSARVRASGRATSRRTLRIGIVAALATSTIATAGLGVAQSLTTRRHLPAGEPEALAFLRDHASTNAVVLSLWDDGYDVQGQAHRRTVVDGLLENAENRRRILELDTALMAPTAEPLLQLCDRYGASWLLVPPLTSLHGVAAVAGDPIAGKIERGEALIRGVDTDRVLFHLMTQDARISQLRPAFAAGGFVVYRYVSQDSTTNSIKQ